MNKLTSIEIETKEYNKHKEIIDKLIKAQCFKKTTAMDGSHITLHYFDN